MKRTNIQFATSDGHKEVAAYVSEAFPGIAIHKHPDFDWWTATHIQSGLAISTAFRLRRLASCFANLASRLIDFTRPVEEVQQHVADNCELGSQIRKLAQRFKT